MQTGRYNSLYELDDLVGVKVVVLRRSLIRSAIEITSEAFEVLARVDRRVNPNEFGYRQPHLIVRPHAEYRERNRALEGLRIEIQFTTTLQHALDTVTHQFDYKGSSFDWRNFRVVAQLRGTLELADSILDNMEASAALMESGVPPTQEFLDGQATLDVLCDVFSSDVMPPDRRRMAMVVVGWLSALDSDSAWLQEVLAKHGDLVAALSLSPVDAVLGVILREAGASLVAAFQGCFYVSAELESLCADTRLVPPDRRVSFAH